MATRHFRALALMLVAIAVPAHADTPLTERVAAILRAQGSGTRFGLVVADMNGREIVAIAPDDRFVPASNTKLFTTAAAFAALGDVMRDDADGGAAVRLDRDHRGPPDVIVEGHGDARLSSAADCVRDCLAALADAVAAKARVVRHVIGDDTAFPDERWSPGMSWNNMPTRSGTGISALTLDDNELVLRVSPGVAAGSVPTIDTLRYYRIDNRTTTTTGRTDLRYDRAPGGDVIRVEGTIRVGAEPTMLRVGIDDPAHYAGWRLRGMLVARGVRVTGGVSVRHRALSPADDPAIRGTAPPARPPRAEALARLIAPPLIDDLTPTNKVSQNVHAELLLRRIGLVAGSGSIADGQAAVRGMLDAAGVERWRYDLADGSGMSSYNRVSPRGVVRFLRWTQTQPWGATYRATLPIGGVDGSLRRRFAGTALAGKVFAKTGTLNAASALSGFLVAASGRTLVFATFAGDMPEDAPASATVDAALLLIAAEN
ncbi:D-alanyl-D-alanine carboxypeptidase/D-alanyl-D-alanine endopeptidase [Sphingomonas sp.]|jgi:D-alanyl-D-alanine carboxypeptidase/D-alanyl-D-alanine-endopeptidase (penicillin-binding protein 4)|uniref:D-alanyl-D-alanine carboxypeptidase/D-alanyl-D-alanine endopeptidase n=1 Tax=Sphingomonas sp. TaxID=28214 RepID=UPI002EDB9007